MRLKVPIIAVVFGCSVGLGLGLLLRAPSDGGPAPGTGQADRGVAPGPDAATGAASRSGACAARVLEGPSMASRAAFSPGASEVELEIPEVEVARRTSGHGSGLVRLKSKVDGVVAFAFQYKTNIFEKIMPKAPRLGHARRGAQLEVARLVKGRGCWTGKWYLLASGGYACTTGGFTVGVNPEVPDVQYRLAARERSLIYPWMRQKKRGNPRLYRIPTAEEEEEIEKAAASPRKKKPYPEVVERAMDGAFLLAIDRLESYKGRRYYRTIRGRYIKAGTLERWPIHPMHGVMLEGDNQLPMAFVFGEDRPMLRQDGAGAPAACGVARKHARFPVAEELTSGGLKLVRGPDGVLLPREHVRVARKVTRPSKVSPGKRWIHVDLSEQTLVAYEGDRPVFATLVSSGKEGYAPPRGVFRLYFKYLSVTMNDTDPVDGWYEVEEVPWTMYYWESFALHGAYWHNDFGTPRSHGCTNLAPPDAKWLFHWTTPRLPPEWNAKRFFGTRVYYSK